MNELYPPTFLFNYPFPFALSYQISPPWDLSGLSHAPSLFPIKRGNLLIDSILHSNTNLVILVSILSQSCFSKGKNR